MLRFDRQEQMLAALREGDVLSLTEATRRFGASPATVRRDFTELAANGLAQRIRGGIRRHAETSRPGWFSPVKAAIARAAAERLDARSVVFVDGGTTTAHLAWCLPDSELRIITNSLRLVQAVESVGGTGVDLFLAGGFVHLKTGILLGPNAAAALGQYHADVALVSAAGVTLDGITNTHELVVDAERAMIANARQVILLADHEKLGRQSMCRVCGLDQIQVLVTDRHSASAAMVAEIAAAGVEIVMVDAQ
jgi:DeoR/GlpR family transcriptional regulator of sugar metabolism